MTLGKIEDLKLRASVLWVWKDVSRCKNDKRGRILMSEKHPECPLYNPLNCKEYYNPKLCAFVRKDKVCLKKKKPKTKPKKKVESSA